MTPAIEQPQITRRIERLQEYDLEIEHRTGIYTRRLMPCPESRVIRRKISQARQVFESAEFGYLKRFVPTYLKTQKLVKSSV